MSRAARQQQQLRQQHEGGNDGRGSEHEQRRWQQQQQQQQVVPSLFTGHGLPKPQCRTLSSGMFGLVEDAFASRTLELSNSSSSSSSSSGSARGTRGSSGAGRSSEPPAHGVAPSTEQAITAVSIGSGIKDSEGKVVDTPIECIKISSELHALPWQLSDKSSQSRLLIKGGRLVNDDQAFDGDLYIEDGIIKQIGQNLITPGGARVLDAKGKLVIPGGIDVSTRLQFLDCHANTQSTDDYYSGTRAALAGGTTMIVDLVPPSSTMTLGEAFAKQRHAADTKVCCDYALTVAIGSWNEQVQKDMQALSKDKGVNTFQISLANNRHPLSDADIYRLFKSCHELGAIAQVHAENGAVIVEKAKELVERGISGPEGHAISRPEEIEGEATRRAITIAHQADCALLVANVTSKTAANEISAARKRGCIVYGAPSAAAIGTDGSHHWNSCWRHAAGHVTSPPLRPDPTTPEVLLDLLSSGDLEATGSDHCTFNADQKAIGKDDFRKIPNGVNGVEDRMSLLWEKGVCTGKMDPCKFVAVTSTNSAKMLNIYPQKGRIAVGSDADLVIWDGETTRTISAKNHKQNVDFNIFEGMVCHGVPTHVITAGRVVVDDDGLHVSQGSGQFVATPCNSPYAYGRQQNRAKMFMASSAPVAREPYTGPVAKDVADGADSRAGVAENPIVASENAFHSRPPTRSGGRHMQDSSFALNGEQIDEGSSKRPHQKISNPPGGRSVGLW